MVKAVRLTVAFHSRWSMSAGLNYVIPPVPQNSSRPSVMAHEPPVVK
jgi:hypothetical protein